jgi:hypothetical protein
MKEYMLLIRNLIDHQSQWPAEKHEQFLKACEKYIGELKKENNLIAAQPMVREGILVSREQGAWQQRPFNETKEVIVGYYHVRAEDVKEAVAFAQRNPEFEYSATARIEVRPIKMKEDVTGFIYPEKS